MLNPIKALDKFYNVEYYLGNSKVATFSSKLVECMDGYLYFQDDDGGLNIIERKAIRSLIAIPSKDTKQNDLKEVK